MVTTKSSHPKVPKKWRDLLMQIPGYDPFKTAETGDWFDESAAQHVIDFFQHPTDGCLRHIEGELAGQSFKLEPWQQAIVGNIFGWKRKNRRGRTCRRYKEAFIFIPRKNGKSPLAAGLALYVLFCEQELGKQIYCAAAEREQASYVFRYARGMVEQEPALATRAQIFKGTGHRSIALHNDPASSMKVLSADADTKHGGNSSMVIIDELHAQPNRDLVDVLQTSLISANRLQPLLIHITTSDYERESICNEKHKYASGVRDGWKAKGGMRDCRFLPVIYEATIDDDWTDPELWARANPNLGVSVSYEDLERECKRAQESPTYENTFKRLHLNIRTEQDVRWMQMDKWDACDGTVDVDELEGRPCYAGLDLASTRDVAACVLYFPQDGGAVVPYFWIPKENAHRRERRDKVPYLTWEAQGFVTLTGANAIDHDVIRHDINEFGARFDIQTIAIDRTNATQLLTQLLGDGFDVVPFGQGFASMTSPTKDLERLILIEQIAHGGNPVLRWMASNAVAETKSPEQVKITKPKPTSPHKVDGIISLIMAIDIAALADESGSVYDNGEPLWL